VDPSTGYRGYRAGQLARLNRVVALKDLGFTLEQVRSLLDERIDVEQVRGMLALRRAQLQESVAADTRRLNHVEARLRAFESEGQMPTNETVLKQLPTQLVVELTDVAASFQPEDIGPIAYPLCAELGKRLAGADVVPAGRLTCYYEKADDDKVIVHAAIPIAGAPGANLNDLTVTELPGAETVATIVHRGRIDGVLAGWQELAKWIEANGYRSTGMPRELYLEVPEDEDKWVTELQEPVTRA
jgi:effector-binding domain-containing protein